MTNENYKGYRGGAKEKLIEFTVRVWSDVEADTTRGIFKGIILPRSETADDKHIVLKLHNGYNVGLSVDTIKNIKEIGYKKVYSDGWTIISTTLGYTESHLIHVVAYDSAGNETRTEPIRIYITHEEEEEEEDKEQPATNEESFILPSPNNRFRYRLNG